MKTETIKMGTTFRSTVADANVLFQVIGKVRGGYKCVAKDTEYAGEQRLFTAYQVQATVRMQSIFQDQDRKCEAFYNALRVGTMVHYNNGFNNYVRCMVVRDAQGQTNLRPMALVGAWKEYDLPSRKADGSINLPHYPKMIRDGKSFHPHASNIYEFQHNDHAADPNTFFPIDLSVPELDDAMQKRAKLHQAINALYETLNNRDNNDPEATLLACQKIISEAV